MAKKDTLIGAPPGQAVPSKSTYIYPILSPLVDSSSMDTQQASAVAGPSNAGAREIPTRASHPRQLIIYDPTTGDWNGVNDSKPEDKRTIITTDYLAVSYRQTDFDDKIGLERDVRNICEVRQLNAYWLDVACTGTEPEDKNEDLYRLADIFREAKETVIMLPEGRNDGWTSWGGRVWTFPEALLSRKLLFKDGKKRVQETDLRKVASLAYSNKEDQERLAAYYGTGGKDFARFRDRFEDLCRGIWSRTSGPGTSISKNPQFTAWPGERVYALMGFLQCRIEPRQRETLEEAFDRLLGANGLECNNYPWESDKEFKVWDKDDRRTAEDIPSHYYVRSAKWSDSRCAVKTSCAKGTRVDILNVIGKWLESKNSKNVGGERVFWVHGYAGSGKSTIARTIAKSCDEDGTLAATFFCSRDSEECRNIYNIFCTISYQLCDFYKPFRKKVSAMIKEDKNLHEAQVEIQLRKLIVEPLKALQNTGIPMNRFVVVIDALDECIGDRTEDKTISLVLNALGEHIDDLAPLKFLITSRPEDNIHGGFRTLSLGYNSKSRDLTYESQTDIDILLYLRSKFQTLGSANQPWPSKKDLGALVKKASGLFIFASTAVIFLLDRDVGDRESQLRTLLYSNAPSSNSPYAHLDQLYIQILDNKVKAKDSLLHRLRKAFAILLSAKERVTIELLEGLLPDTRVGELFQDLRSLVSIPESRDDYIRLIHPSIQDFLTDEKRCTNKFLIKQPNILLTECCAAKLLQCLDGGTDIFKLSKRGNISKYDSQKEKDAIAYASYHIGDHLQQFAVDDLKEASKIIFDKRLIMLLLTKDMKDWVKTTLLKFLTEDSLSLEVHLKLYSHILLLLNFKVYDVGSLPYLRIIANDEWSQLLERKEILAAKYPDIPAFKINCKEFVLIESLLFYIQHSFKEGSELSDESTEMYRLLSSQVELDEVRSLDFDIIVQGFADEIRISQSQSLMHSRLGEVLERYNCKPMKFEWMKIKQILKRYKDLIHYCLDGDGRSLSNLYEAAFATIKRQYSIQDSNETHDLFRAIVGIGQANWDADILSFFFSSASVHLSAYLNLLPLDKVQLFYFVREPDQDFIVDVSDMNLLSFKDIHDSTVTVSIILPECTSNKQMLSRHRQHKDNPKYRYISPRLILNHSVLVELANKTPSSLVIEEVQISEYKKGVLSFMARWCLTKVNEILQGLDGGHYYHSASGCLTKVKEILQGLDGRYYYHMVSAFPCMDLRSFLKTSKDNEVSVYAMKYWSYYVWQCASNQDGFTLQLIQDILSYGSDLYYATPKETRQSSLGPKVMGLIIETSLSRGPAVSRKLMRLLDENTLLFGLQKWIDGEHFYWMFDRETLREKYSINDGLYELEQYYSDLRVTLLAYRIGYMKNLENTNDPELVEKALNVRKLARAAHDTIIYRGVPEDDQVKWSIKDYMEELDGILKENRRPLFVGDSEDEDETDSDDHDDTDSNDEDDTDSDDEDDTGPDDSKLEGSADENRMVLSQAVDAFSTTIDTFFRDLDEISTGIESNNDGETSAGANLAVGGDGDIVPRIGVGEDTGHSVDAIERIEDEAGVRFSAELEETVGEGPEVVIEKALNVRNLAKAAHDTIMERRVPEDKQAKSTIEVYMEELAWILKENRRPLFIGGDTKDNDVENTGPENSKLEESPVNERVVLNQAIDTCSAALENFIRRLDETLEPIESNSDCETNAGVSLVVSGDEDTVSISIGEDAGDSVDGEVATARIEEAEGVRDDAEPEVTNDLEREFRTTSDENIEHSVVPQSDIESIPRAITSAVPDIKVDDTMDSRSTKINEQPQTPEESTDVHKQPTLGIATDNAEGPGAQNVDVDNDVARADSRWTFSVVWISVFFAVFAFICYRYIF